MSQGSAILSASMHELSSLADGTYRITGWFADKDSDMDTSRL